MRSSAFVFRIVAGLILAVLFVVSQPAIGFAAQHGSLPSQRTTPRDSANAEATDAAEDAIDSLEDAYKAVVQIEAVGTFEDPAEGVQLNAAGRGSGFIIDSAGIAVTNNHVVTGGALFRVFVDGSDKPLNARVLGVSECADLAVIDIQGDGFPYLDWYDGNIRVGLDVFALGFPLGDPEFTMTGGIISKSNAGGESSWASVDSVLQHDADILPGNSGGPLVDENARVVGINYRMNDARQYFAISRDEALDIIETLRSGDDVDSLGINGEAVSDGEKIFGIWVSSIKSGSPADEVGLLPGDIILRMEGIDLAADGTMADYCDILRSHSPSDVLAIEVLRLKSEELLEGQFNGRPLEASFSFSDAGSGDSGSADTGQSGSADSGSAGYTDFMPITDEQGILTTEVPVEWGDVQEYTWEDADEEPIGIQLWAAPDIDEFSSDWGVPGVVLSFSDQFDADVTAADLIEAIDYSDECEKVERVDLPDGFFSGVYDLYSGCGESGSSAILMGLQPETEDYLVRVEIYSATEADLDASDRILDTFVVTPPGTVQEERTGDGDEYFHATVDDIDTSGLVYTYSLVEDVAASGLLPDAWDDVDADEWVVDGDAIGYYYAASSSQRAFNAGWDTPGMTIYSAAVDGEDLSALDALDNNDFSDTCTYEDRVQHQHTIYGITYTGAYDIWSNCGDEENAFVVLAAASEPADHLVLLYFLAVDDGDYEAFDVLSASFYVVTPATEGLISASQEANVNRESTVDPADFDLLVDDEDAVSVLVPPHWSDTVSEDWEVDGDVIGRAISAAPDLAGFQANWATPGIFIGVSDTLADVMTPPEILDVFDYADECAYDDRYEFENDAFTGAYDIWTDCGDVEGMAFMVFAANPSGDDSTVMLLYISMVDPEDFDSFETIIGSVALEGQVGQTETDALATATVVTNALNLRSGPGTNYGKLATVNRDDELTVVGQYDSCSWLLVFTPDGQPGWVSGRAEYVALDADCGDIVEVDAPEPPAAASGSNRTGSGQGCYTFQNQLGAELNITFTNRDTKWNKTFKVAPKGESRQCFDPGRYTYTLDAPPPWGSTNGELTINAGDNFAFPIYAE